MSIEIFIDRHSASHRYQAKCTWRPTCLLSYPAGVRHSPRNNALFEISAAIEIRLGAQHLRRVGWRKYQAWRADIAKLGPCCWQNIITVLDRGHQITLSAGHWLPCRARHLWLAESVAALTIVKCGELSLNLAIAARHCTRRQAFSRPARSSIRGAAARKSMADLTVRLNSAHRLQNKLAWRHVYCQKKASKAYVFCRAK